MTIRRSPIAVCTALLLLAVVPARASDTLRPDQVAYRELFRELVETNTTLSAGNCTEAADKMAARLRNAGLPEADLHPFTVPGHAKEGGLVAVLKGRDPTARPILLLAHIDVVEAKREDWTRDPFTLVEENGYFYARGIADDKAMASIWADTSDPVPAGRLQAAAHAEDGADLRRGNQRCLQRRAIPVDQQPRPDRCRVRAQRRRLAARSTTRATGSMMTVQAGEKASPELPARSDAIRADTARAR